MPDPADHSGLLDVRDPRRQFGEHPGDRIDLLRTHVSDGTQPIAACAAFRTAPALQRAAGRVLAAASLRIS